MATAERELTAPAQSAEGVLDAGEDWTPQPYRWTREQFYRMGDLGLFEGRRAILVEGEILSMPAMGNLHRHTLTLASDILRELFGVGFFVSAQCPFDVGTATDPEPDIAIIRGNLGDYRSRGLTEAALIVEVSDTTLAFDRREKMSLYARAGIADYWIIDINGEQIEVHRQPVADDAQPFGYGYREKAVHRSGEIIQPLGSPKPVAVLSLLP